MQAHPRDVVRVAAAGPQIRLVSVECPGHRRRFRRDYPTSGKGARLVLRLPEIENAVAVRIVVIIGRADSLGPGATFTVCNPRDPYPGRLVAAIAETDP